MDSRCSEAPVEPRQVPGWNTPVLFVQGGGYHMYVDGRGHRSDMLSGKSSEGNQRHNGHVYEDWYILQHQLRHNSRGCQVQRSFALGTGRRHSVRADKERQPLVAMTRIREIGLHARDSLCEVVSQIRP